MCRAAPCCSLTPTPCMDSIVPQHYIAVIQQYIDSNSQLFLCIRLNYYIKGVIIYSFCYNNIYDRLHKKVHFPLFSIVYTVKFLMKQDFKCSMYHSKPIYRWWIIRSCATHIFTCCNSIFYPLRFYWIHVLEKIFFWMNDGTLVNLGFIT
jgi:hypothetical protein